MKFFCNYCNYSTDVKFCYEKHLLSKKHEKKGNEMTMLSQHYPKVIPSLSLVENEFKCSFCNNIYSNAPNLSRHKNYCGEKQRLINNYQNHRR